MNWRLPAAAGSGRKNRSATAAVLLTARADGHGMRDVATAILMTATKVNNRIFCRPEAQGASGWR